MDNFVKGVCSVTYVFRRKQKSLKNQHIFYNLINNKNKGVFGTELKYNIILNNSDEYI